jgi:hypothetical protein
MRLWRGWRRIVLISLREMIPHAEREEYFGLRQQVRIRVNGLLPFKAHFVNEACAGIGR